MPHFRLLIFTVLISSGGLQAQILRDSASLKLVKEATGYVYNMQFDDAVSVCNKINDIYPDHPVVLLLKCMISYWQNFPLTATSPNRVSFEGYLHKCIEKCENYKPEDEAEYILATQCARGLLLLFYADNDLNSKVFSLAKNSYRYMRRAFEFTQTFPDFYFFTGLYNYYREAYPEAHPFYRPLLILFPRGDRTKGLKELQTAFEKSIFMQSEASYFLSSNYKYFENNYQKASVFSKALYRRYPANMEYRSNCIEDLLLSRKYDEAEQLITSAKIKNSYQLAELSVFRGILNEKKYHDMKTAEQEYLEGIKEVTPYGDYGTQYAAYAYFGLSRISALNDDRHNQRIYRKKALELTDFRKVNFDDPETSSP
jgi:hypothetical protein